MSTAKKILLSVCIATHNEEANLGPCLDGVKEIADEIVIVDGESTDRTVEIAKSYGAHVFVVPNQTMFHINKQKSFEKAHGEWILYLDADEIVTPELSREVRKVAEGTHQELDLTKYPTFARHMQIIGSRDGVSYTQQEPINAYFMPRKNYFLGSYLMHSGVYPDGVIRLFRRTKGYLPCKTVHEQVAVEGGVSWLSQDLIHMADPTFKRYLWRANRYTSLTAEELEKQKVGKSLPTVIQYMVVKPVTIFVLLFLRHKGFMDGFSGFVWSLMSALHWPIAYCKYYERTH